MRRFQRWYVLICEIMFGKLKRKVFSHNLRSHKRLQLKPSVRSEDGKRSLWSWDDLRARIKLETLVSLNTFNYTFVYSVYHEMYFLYLLLLL